MTIDVERYQKLKDNVDRLQREADRAEGALDQLMVKLKEDYGCDTIEEAETKAAKLGKAATKAEVLFETAFAKFRVKWAEVL